MRGAAGAPRAPRQVTGIAMQPGIGTRIQSLQSRCLPAVPASVSQIIGASRALLELPLAAQISIRSVLATTNRLSARQQSSERPRRTERADLASLQPATDAVWVRQRSVSRAVDARKWKAWLQTPHATVHSSEVADAWFAWHLLSQSDRLGRGVLDAEVHCTRQLQRRASRRTDV